MRRVLITGGSGLLALNWACRMRDGYDVILAQHAHTSALRGVRCLPLDLESADAFGRHLEQLKPDLLVHTAGLTNVDLCEQQPEEAMHANAALALNVARAANFLGIRLIHISTDHLFDGTQALRGEDDAPSPLNAYARTKLQAEQWVQQEHPRAMLVRTNFFGWGNRYRQSFSDWILAGLRAGKPLDMFENVYFTPILADVLAASAHTLADHDERGIINVAGDERISKYEFARRLAAAFDLPGRLIRRARLSRSSLAAKRPLDMSLDSSRARKRLGGSFGTLDGFFATLRQQEADGRQQELYAAVRE